MYVLYVDKEGKVHVGGGGPPGDPALTIGYFL